MFFRRMETQRSLAVRLTRARSQEVGSTAPRLSHGQAHAAALVSWNSRVPLSPSGHALASHPSRGGPVGSQAAIDGTLTKSLGFGEHELPQEGQP